MATINLNNLADIVQTKSHRVYTKAAWSDNWTLRTNLFCVQSVWCALPAMPTATLQYFYGSVLTPGASALASQSIVDLRSQFVLVEWIADDNTLIHWLGYIDSIDEHAIGDGSGYLLMTCFGLDRALQVTPITTHVWNNAGTAQISNWVPDFNADGIGNRANAKIGGAFVFSKETTGDFWSTRDIVEYLMTYCLPTPDGKKPATNPIPWSIANLTMLPDWDRPTVQADALTVHSVLYPLVSPRNLVGANVGFAVTAGANPTISSVVLNIFSMLDTQLTLGSGETVPAAATQHTITYNQDPLTTGTLRDNGVETVDQIIVRGARRVAIQTVKVGTELEKAWTNDQQNNYNTGSTDPNLSTFSQDEQRRLHADVRTDDVFADVYSRLKLVDDHNLPTESGDLHVTAPHAMTILDRLPLLSGVDYSGDPTAVDESSGGDPIHPLVWFGLPGNVNTLVPITSLGGDTGSLNASSPFGAFGVEAQFDADRTMRLVVNDAPQHAIGGTDFVPTTVDNTNLGAWAYTTVQATVAITDDRYCETRYPETLSGTYDVVRRRIFHAGDGYRKTFIKNGTVVAIDASGTPQTSSGGFVHDDTEKLADLAEILAKYYATPRKDLDLETKRRLSTLAVGHFVTTANGESVNAPINEIRITAPLAFGTQQIQSPTMSIGTWSGSIDPLAVLDSFRNPGRK